MMLTGKSTDKQTE